MRLQDVCWTGRLDDVGFLSRIYDLKDMSSYDGRFANAAGDIWQHRINNLDWEPDWVFDDPRFGLLRGPDDQFLRFLAETVHPIVRPDAQEVQRLVATFNELLRVDGWELHPATSISGRPVYSARRLVLGGHATRAAKAVADVLDADYVTQQITRMETAIEFDPELAIGTAKELAETICKSILDERGASVNKGWDLPQLVKATAKELNLAPDQVPDAAKGAETIRILLSSLASVASKMAELRNLYGTGHGKTAATKGLQSRHAKLAVGAASTLAVFLIETHEVRKAEPDDGSK